MSKDHWDAILASSPLNATAGKVTSKGVSFEPAALQTEHSWDAPPPMKNLAKYLIDPGFRNFTGFRTERLTVLGLSADSHDPTGSKGALWICRCACGRYVGRRTKSLKTGKARMCNVCAYTEHLRFYASGDEARKRAEAPEAQKWKPAA